MLFWCFPLSGSQDIRNVIPFSGRGIVLGGATQPSASTQKPPIRSPTHSPKPVQKPDRTSPADLRSPYGVTSALPKRSVSNHKAFVNINGSPVRITKTNGSLVRPKQRTVQDLFQNGNLKSLQKTNPTELNQASNTPVSESALNLDSARPSLVNKSSSGTSRSEGSPLSKYFGSAKSIGIPGQIKPENGIPGFISRHFENRKRSAAGISGSGSTSRIKAENSVPHSNAKSFESSETGSSASIPSSNPGASSTDFGSRVQSSHLTHLRKPKAPGTGIPVSSSTNPIRSEHGIQNSNLKHFGRQKSSGISTSSSIPSSSLRLSGSPEKSGSFIPASTSGSPHKPGTAAGGRKRWREDRNSAHIFDFFQRVSHSPALSSSSFSTEHGEEGTGAKVPSVGASGVCSAPLSSSALTVTCPVCQSKVLESQINQHLDSCLM